MSGAALLLLGIVAVWLNALVAGQLQTNKAPDDLQSSTRDVLRPTKIRGPGGRPVNLRCTGEQTPRVPRLHASAVLWQYMSCGNAHGSTPCKNYVDDKDLSNWITLTGESFNRTTATLQKATEKDNGLYRCSVKNKSHPKILTTYELDIVDIADSRPEIIQGPDNQTVAGGARVSFQCLVLSKIEPTVWWFRKQDVNNIEPAIALFMSNRHNNNNSLFLKYFNDTYEAMESHTVKRPQDTYLSKMILKTAIEWDSGFYFCLAVNNVDFVYQGAHLSVILANSQAEEEDMSESSLSWLFLIPVSLAVIPLTVWLCCLWRRRTRSVKTPSDQLDQLQQANPRFKYSQVQNNNTHPAPASRVQ